MLNVGQIISKYCKICELGKHYIIVNNLNYYWTVRSCRQSENWPWYFWLFICKLCYLVRISLLVCAYSMTEWLFSRQVLIYCNCCGYFSNILRKWWNSGIAIVLNSVQLEFLWMLFESVTMEKKIMLKHEMSLLSCKLEDWIITDYSICNFMKYVRHDG